LLNKYSTNILLRWGSWIKTKPGVDKRQVL